MTPMQDKLTAVLCVVEDKFLEAGMLTADMEKPVAKWLASLKKSRKSVTAAQG